MHKRRTERAKHAASLVHVLTDHKTPTIGPYLVQCAVQLAIDTNTHYRVADELDEAVGT